MAVPPNSYRELKSKKSRLISLSPFLDDDDDDDGDVDRRAIVRGKKNSTEEELSVELTFVKTLPP